MGSENKVPAEIDITYFSSNNFDIENEESTESEENNDGDRDEEVKDNNDSIPTENCWLFKCTEDEDFVTENKDVDIEKSVESCWLLKYPDNKETDSSLADDTDVAKEDNDTTPTEFNIWLSNSEEVETTFHEESNETIKLKASIPEVEAKMEVEVPTREEITKIKEKMTLMSLWREADPEEQSWDAVDDTAESEASIVTLDPTEQFDDFSDMQLELSQWISNV